jgi:CRISPR-associated protein Cas2
MVVIILENVRTSVRGELSRWLFEIKAGVFTGHISALVREELWQILTDKIGQGSALMLYPARNDQGFVAIALGKPARQLIDIEGLLLVQTH